MAKTLKADGRALQLQPAAAKVAGFMFIFCFVVPTANFGLNFVKLMNDDPAITASNIVANETTFEIGLLVEMIMSAGLLVLAVSLYILLKSEGEIIALIALLWKVVEATLCCGVVLLSFTALQFWRSSATVESAVPMGILLNYHTALYSIPMLFLGLDMPLYFYLFFKSRIIPRSIAISGILSFLFILLHSVTSMVYADLATHTVFQSICYAPSGVLELVIGGWLFFKGVRAKDGHEL